ncbi:FecR domain-containing protein [Bacteroides thetaiotaomicron]|nr:FecR domain-containing protein [Bacteroides thetaiotaomicron]MCS2873058.1 FecR domain-containing protein [Bacteroides thetaiotaomicron]
MEASGNENEISIVLLPDSSTVYLNSQTTLKYPTHFTKERRVYLNGEAYFVVRKQNHKHFIVHTASEAKVEVLGTEFNVKTNKQGTSATLVSGAVKFISRTANKKERSVLIQPGQKISYDAKTATSKVEEVDLETEIGWKDGKIVLEDCPLQEALDILSKKYHVIFRIINDELQNSRFTGTIRKQGVEQIIKNLSISCRFKYRIIKKNNTKNNEEETIIELY